MPKGKILGEIKRHSGLRSWMPEANPAKEGKERSVVMIGTIANAGTILLGSVVGSALKKGIGEKYQSIMMDSMGLAATALGINSIVGAMPQSKYHVLFIVSLALGGLIGTRLSLDTAFDRLVSRFSKGSNLAKGLSTAILLYCAGTLSILGPIESALNGDHSYLFTIYQCHSGRHYLRCPFLHLWAGDRHRGRRTVLLAGLHLPAGQPYRTPSDSGPADRDLSGGRSSHSQLGTEHFEHQAVQNAEPAAGPSGAACGGGAAVPAGRLTPVMLPVRKPDK